MIEYRGDGTGTTSPVEALKTFSADNTPHWLAIDRIRVSAASRTPDVTLEGLDPVHVSST